MDGLRKTLLLLLLAIGSHAFTEFHGRAHHSGVDRAHTRAEAEETVLNTLRSLVGSKIEAVDIGEAFDSKITTASESVSFTFDVTLTLEDGMTRDALLEAVHTDEDNHGLRFVRLSKGSEHAGHPSKSKMLKALPLFPSADAERFNDCTGEECKCGRPCYGRGVFLPNSTCVCDQFWSGKTCEKVDCMGGVPEAEGRCACPPGRFAEHCQPKICAAPFASLLDTSKHRSVVVALNLKNTMARDLQALIPALSTEASKLVTNWQTLYDHFVLYTYLQFNNYTIDSTVETRNVDDFVDALQQVAISKGDDRQPNLAALKTTLNASPQIRARSTVLLFADTIPSDATTWNPDEVSKGIDVEVIEQTLAWGHRLVITITDPPATPIKPDDTDFSALDRITTATHGDLVHTSKKQVDKVAAMLSNLHFAENVYYKPYTCEFHNSIDLTSILDSDGDAGMYRIIVSGTKSIKATASSAAGASTPLTADIEIDNFVSFTAQTSSPVLRIDSSPTNGPRCAIRISVSSSRMSMLAFSQDARVDVGLPTTTQGVTHQLSVYTSMPAYDFTATILDKDGNEIESAVKLAKRDSSCSFSLSAALTSTCRAGSYNVRISAFKSADGKFAFARLLPALCETPVQRSPPGWACLNGGTMNMGLDNLPYCDCMRLYGGEHCELPACHNGASRNPFPTDGDNSTLCICMPGWAGIHCETLASCSKPANANFNLGDRTLSLVLQTSFSQNYLVDSVTAALQSLSAFNYTNYQLVTFNKILKAGVQTNEVVIKNANDIASLVGLLGDSKYKFSSSSTQSTANAILSGLTDLEKNGKLNPIVFVITDSDEDSDDKTVRQMRQSAATNNAAIHIIRTPQFEDGCGDRPASASSEAYTKYSTMSGGVFIDLCTTGYKTTDLTQALSGLASHYPTEQLVDVVMNGAGNCMDAPIAMTYETNTDRRVVLRVVGAGELDATVTVIRADDGNATATKQIFSLASIAEYELPLGSPDDGNTLYNITIKFNKQGGCYAYIFTDSDDSLFYSYTSMGTKDVVMNQPLFGKPLAPVLHIQSPSQSGLTPGASFFAYDNAGQLTYSSGSGELRDGCSYELLWPKMFACPTHDEPFVLKSEITKKWGEGEARINHRELSHIRRVWFPYCVAPDVGCINGNLNATSNSCECNNGYEGDWCDQPVCANGGIRYNDVCMCPTLYTGARCEYAMCSTWDFQTARDPKLRGFRSVTFVMELTKNAVVANSMFKVGVRQMLEDMDSNGGLKQFNLVTYDDVGYALAATSASSSRFFEQFNLTMASSNHKDSTPKTTKAFDAIDAAISLDVTTPNLIVAFVSAASTPDLTKIRQHPGVQVNIIYTPLEGNDPMLPTNSPFYLYQSLPMLTGGRVIPSTQVGAYDLPRVVGSFNREMSLVALQGAKDCSGAGFTISFNIESIAQRFVIQITGTDITPSSATITNPDGNVMNIGADKVLMADKSAMILEFADKPLKGTWTVKAITKGKCLIQARAESTLTALIGFTSDIHNDFVNELPFSKTGLIGSQTTRFVLSTPSAHGLLYSFDTAQLSDIDFTTGAVTPRSTISVSRRDYGLPPFGPGIACAYQFVSDEFKFPSTFTAITVTGKNLNSGEPIQRTYVLQNMQLDCKNNGKNKNTGECDCSGTGFTGDTCEVALCANGGSYSGPLCLCASGYKGAHCEEIITQPTPTTAGPTGVPTTVPATGSTAPPATGTSAAPASTAPPATTIEHSTAEPTTTEPPTCYIDSVTYNVVFFLENAQINPTTPNFGGQTANQLADTMALGTVRQKTFYEFISAGVNASTGGEARSKVDIDDAIHKVNADSPEEMNTFNLGHALSWFVSSKNFADYTSDAKFAVIISALPSSDAAKDAAKALVAKNFALIGVALLDEAQGSLQTITPNVIQTFLPDEASDFIKKIICKVHPRSV